MSALESFLKLTNMSIGNVHDISYMHLLENGNLKLMPAAELRKYPHEHLMQWSKENGRYLLPTTELVDWLRKMIGTRHAIEVAAGMGDLGSRIPIVMTDSYMQVANPEVQLLYQMVGQRITTPPESVQKFEAIAAIDHFKPQVVVAGFLTQKYQEGDTEQGIGSSVYGPDEFEILKRVDTYIMIGNEKVHEKKRIMTVPHATYNMPWLVTRCKEPDLNRIWVWNK